MIALSDKIAATGHQAVVRRHRLRRRHRLAGHRLARGRRPARRRARRLRPVGQPRDPVQRPARSSAAARPRRRHPQERGVRQRRLRRREVDRDHHVPGRRPADPQRRVRPAPPGELLRRQLARGHRRRRERRRLRLLPPDHQRGLRASRSSAVASSSPRSPTSREVQAFQTYLSSDVWANEKAKATPFGGWVSANTGLDIDNLATPIDQLSGRDAAGPRGGLPLRRLRPDAGCGRRRLLLEAR